jgi:tRNA nucleotidyltransferase (CCA-adding enzyme)
VKIYLVGGAVRDQLLGQKVSERDFVVVGATPDDLTKLGFRPVGNDFPVFLHPQTKEEYALARTERKTGHGYTGFECFSDPSVTLEEDLARRDLTINAMAQACEFSGLDLRSISEEIIDPYHGQEDLKHKILKHVSPAFSEDPVRILRLARFAARFTDFSVDPQTNQLMLDMVNAGEVNALVPERVWKEFSRALTENAPSRFFSVLKACEALAILFPEIHHNLKSLDFLQTTAFSISQSETKNKIALYRFCSLALELKTPEITSLCQRLHPPAQFSELAILIANSIQSYITLDLNTAETVIQFLEKMDAYRRPSRFYDFCFIADFAVENKDEGKKVSEALHQAFENTKDIDVRPFIDQGLKGEAISTAIHLARVERLKS